MIMMYLVLIYGLLLGSFYNVVGIRVPQKKSIVAPRSACPHCGHELKAWELIPVVSYFLVRGKCSSCRTPISPIYPIMEALTGFLFAFAYWKVGLSAELLVALLLISLLVIISISDLHFMLIPDRILLWFASFFLVTHIWFSWIPWLDSFIGAAVGFILLLLIAIISKGGMGGGDIKLYAVIGFVLGWKLTLLSFMLASAFGAVVGVILMTFRKASRKQAVPFGPFISLGVLVAYFNGEDLIFWYVTYFM
ncbi:prepilin peptidase [Mangrovibacillus cuniculi]|uniref:Prepilin peptidase n=2 Tax=Mangrovibacillus cuniculi TaxID=2593652 RepID=A0A7S8CEC1_9BACI|nr:prepilin peptidase [Mangrovibacillus cuniculi]